MQTRTTSIRKLTPVLCGLMTLSAVAALFGAADLRLLEAVERQDRPTVQALLKQHVDVNAARGDGLSALASAVHLDDQETVDLLIRAGANVNATNDLGVTPLMLAAVNGNAAITGRLLQAKADPKAARSTGETAMLYAARTGKTEVIKLLVGAGAGADDKLGVREQTPLMWAAAEGHADAVKLLIEVGANVNAITKSKKVPAPNGHYVANRKPIERTDKTRSVITILWPKDGDDDMYRFDGGMTPLFFAIDGGHQDVVRELLDAGVKVDGPNPDGVTPLQFAMIRRNEALALFLLERGADPNNAGPGFPPLHMAAYLDQPAAAKALIAGGADVNVRIEKPYRLIELLEVGTNRYPGSGLFTNIGSTPFMTAAKHGQIEIMRMLLAKGANPMLTAKGGENALMVAAGLGRPEPTNVTYHVFKESEQLEAIKMCLELGLDINAQNRWGQTALHGAAFQDFPRVIELLAAEGAWLDPTDWQDQTPLRIAQGHEICCSTFHRMSLSAAALLKVGADPNAGIVLKFAAHDYQDDTVKTATDQKDK
jgi:ankyrin repeat protein